MDGMLENRKTSQVGSLLSHLHEIWCADAEYNFWQTSRDQNDNCE